MAGKRSTFNIILTSLCFFPLHLLMSACLLLLESYIPFLQILDLTFSLILQLGNQNLKFFSSSHFALNTVFFVFLLILFLLLDQRQRGPIRSVLLVITGW